MANEDRYVISLEACDEGRIDAVGGKSAGLGRMMRAGVPVPSGFAISSEAFTSMLSSGDVAAEVSMLAAGVDPSDVEGLEATSQKIRVIIERAAIPAEVEVAVRGAYAELCGGVVASGSDLPVAVRSSATAEDLPEASFAGQQDTFLWVVGADDLLDHVRRCWSSLYTGRAMAYRLENGFDHDRVRMSVCVQKMVDARAAGVMFTLNPSNGDRSKVAIEASWGLGEAVASGEVTPDNYLVDKVSFDVVRRTISSKAIEYRPVAAERRVERVAVDPERREAPCISDEEIIVLATHAKAIESAAGTPQDLEWAIEAGGEPPANVVLLQTRPETVWSGRGRATVTEGERSAMDNIVANLITGVRIRAGPSRPDTPDTAGSPAQGE